MGEQKPIVGSVQAEKVVIANTVNFFGDTDNRTTQTDDVRVNVAISKLSPDEQFALACSVGGRRDGVLEVTVPDLSGENAGFLKPAFDLRTRILDKVIPRLLDAQLIAFVGKFETGEAAYQVTSLGRSVVQRLKPDCPEIKHSAAYLEVKTRRDAAVTDFPEIKHSAAYLKVKTRRDAAVKEAMKRFGQFD